MSEPRVIVTVPTARIRDDLEPLPEGVEVLEWDLDDPAPRDRIDCVVLPYSARENVAHLAGLRVRLVQGQMIGYDNVEDHLPAGNVLANASTVHEAATAELAVGLMLASQRSLDLFIRRAADAIWERLPTPGLADSRVLLLGYGGVGAAIARRLTPFEVELTAVATRARTEDGIEVHAIGDLHTLLPTTDILVASLPGGPDTHHLVDDAVLSALPDGALVVNVGRGTVVDTDALVAHVQRGRLRAALDVVDPEPLPADNPLWRHPGAIVVPHVGGLTDAGHPRIAKLIRRQIDHLLAGEEPENIVLRT